VVEELATRNPHVRCVTHPKNRGYGEALRTGFSSSTKEMIFFTDGDKQFDINEVAEFIPVIADADMVIGYRRPRMDPPVRIFYAIGWKLLVTTLFGYAARDIDCAFKLFRREVWESVRVKSGGATFSAEFLVKARRKGYRVKELPVTHYPRTAGSPTGGNPRVILRAFRDLVWLRLHLNDG
jgi:glycosyltransferase involved in cell wall biosynthesis